MGSNENRGGHRPAIALITEEASIPKKTAGTIDQAGNGRLWSFNRHHDEPRSHEDDFDNELRTIHPRDWPRRALSRFLEGHGLHANSETRDRILLRCNRMHIDRAIK